MHITANQKDASEHGKHLATTLPDHDFITISTMLSDQQPARVLSAHWIRREKGVRSKL
jgi:hypothetical protein